MVYLTYHWGTRSNHPVKPLPTLFQLNLWRSPFKVSTVLCQSLLIWLLAIITKCSYCRALFIFRSTWIEYFYPEPLAEVSNIFNILFSTFSINCWVFLMILSQCNPGFDSRSPPSTVACYSYSDQDELNISLHNLHIVFLTMKWVLSHLFTFEKYQEHHVQLWYSTVPLFNIKTCKTSEKICSYNESQSQSFIVCVFMLWSYNL